MAERNYRAGLPKISPSDARGQDMLVAMENARIAHEHIHRVMGYLKIALETGSEEHASVARHHLSAAAWCAGLAKMMLEV